MKLFDKYPVHNSSTTPIFNLHDLFSIDSAEAHDQAGALKNSKFKFSMAAEASNVQQLSARYHHHLCQDQHQYRCTIMR